jgi:hypothetical protein
MPGGDARAVEIDVDNEGADLNGPRYRLGRRRKNNVGANGR